MRCMVAAADISPEGRYRLGIESETVTVDLLDGTPESGGRITFVNDHEVRWHIHSVGLTRKPMRVVD